MNAMIEQDTTTNLEAQETSPKILQGRAAKRAWKAWLGEGNKPSASQLAIYATLRGANLNKTFTPITNQKKLANGQHAWDGRQGALNKALRFLHEDYLPFAEMFEGATSEKQKWWPNGMFYLAASHPLLTDIKTHIETFQKEAS